MEIKRRGRPRRDDPNEFNYLLRMSADDYYKLVSIAEKKGATRADVLRKGIDMQFRISNIDY